MVGCIILGHLYFFYIRPRRFGKSLTLSMLKQYYDVNMADRFEELFGGLYIGENPTPEHNTYLIISLNKPKALTGYAIEDTKQLCLFLTTTLLYMWIL